MKRDQWAALILGLIALAVISPWRWMDAPPPVVHAEPEPEPYYAPQPAPAPAPEPLETYAILARVVKTKPYDGYKTFGTDFDVQITNTSPLHIKHMGLEMQYTGHNGEYLGVCMVSASNVPPGATVIGQGHQRDTRLEQLGGYTLRVDAVVGADGLLMSERFTVAEQ